MPSDEELAAWLEKDEARSRPYRVERLRLLLSHYGPEGVRVFPGGPVSAIAFEEARQAYLHGLFLSCVITSQVCLEQMLAGIFSAAGRDDLVGAGFHDLLKEALNAGFIFQEEFTLFDRLRTLRNPYVHYRPPTHGQAIGRRAATEDVPIDILLIEDAKFAITALLRLCRRPPFALGQ